ncbi:hypothetical protein [uncultured Croceitalea sp.]|uniref:hypothetical protein n=1 Tax=uncultured Croceitalea sp. TaxID=1798908 RepID=UPI00330595DB
MKNVFCFAFLIKKLLLVSFFVLNYIYCTAQYEFTKSVVVDSIAIDNGESFALYLPSSYNKDEPSPIIFVFDPAARGTTGLTPFLDVSEKHNYIVVCSNNSKNGPLEQNFEIANRLFNYVFSNYSIEESNMLVAGFSGGSRLATTIAVLTNKFSGVIACGAGFSSVPSHTPSTQDFSYVGICGNEDMNYNEMLKNKGFLQRLNFSSTLFTYNGDHKWPPNEQINRAFRWLQNKKIKDSVLISQNFELDFNEAEAFYSSGELLFSAEVYDRILASYKGFVPLNEVNEKYSSLINSKAYKKEHKSLQDALAQEEKISIKLFDKLNGDFLFPKKVNFSWWKKELNKLEKLNADGSFQLKKMVSRIRFNLFAAVYSRKNARLHNSSSEQISLSNKLQKLIYPN